MQKDSFLSETLVPLDVTVTEKLKSRKKKSVFCGGGLAKLSWLILILLTYLIYVLVKLFHDHYFWGVVSAYIIQFFLYFEEYYSVMCICLNEFHAICRYISEL